MLSEIGQGFYGILDDPPAMGLSQNAEGSDHAESATLCLDSSETLINEDEVRPDVQGELDCCALARIEYGG